MNTSYYHRWVSSYSVPTLAAETPMYLLLTVHVCCEFGKCDDSKLLSFLQAIHLFSALRYLAPSAICPLEVCLQLYYATNTSIKLDALLIGLLATSLYWHICQRLPQ